MSYLGLGHYLELLIISERESLFGSSVLFVKLLSHNTHPWLLSTPLIVQISDLHHNFYLKVHFECAAIKKCLMSPCMGPFES